MLVDLIKKIEEEKGIINIGLFTHKNPDYDAIGSTFTLGNYLQNKLGSKVSIYPILDNFNNLRLNINTNLDKYDENLDINLDYAIVMDVNEEDLLYGSNLLNNICLENRYLFDHHMGNRVPLNILDNNKKTTNDASSTCEVLASELLSDGLIDELNSYNLYLGIAADTVAFNIGVKSNTKDICNKLNVNNTDKEMILTSVSGITKSQEELFKRIEKVDDFIEGLTIYKLLLNSNEEDKVKELYSIHFERIITPTDLYTISFLLVECGNTVFYKLRKHEDSLFDIVELAKKCNGGGHSNRCAGRLVDMDYDEALEHIVLNYKLLNKNNVKKLRR